jgi:hypothetical protein
MQRQPHEWQLEARMLVSGASRVQRPPPGLEAPVEALRAHYALEVRKAAAQLLRDATRRAQMLQRKTNGEARYYAAVQQGKILAQIPAELCEWLCLGPKRTLRKALNDAAALLPPGELWHTRKGWRSLGVPPAALRRGPQQGSMRQPATS